MRTRDFSKATAFFEKASALAPKTAEYHAAIGLSKLGQGESVQAIAELEKPRHSIKNPLKLACSW